MSTVERVSEGTPQHEAAESSETDGSRREDTEIITGERKYADDHSPPGLLHAAIYRSPHAHAQIMSIDLTRATQLDGVLGAFTADDLPDYVGSPSTAYPPDTPIGTPYQDSTPSENPIIRSFEHACLAQDKVRYVGEPVAVVVAEDRYIAEDALDLIHADFDVLPPVLDEVDAMADDSPLLYEEWGTNRMTEFEVESGDVERVFQNAPIVFTETIRHHRFTGTPLEPRVALADFDPDDVHLDIYNPNQNPHQLGTKIGNSLDIPALSVSVNAENIGGGFGLKARYYPEDLLIPFLSIHFERPVKFTERRSEHMVSTVHAREQTHQLTVAIDDDGELLALEDHIIGNAGAAYPSAAARSHITTSQFVPGCYDLQDYRCEVSSMVTNKTPYGAHRGFGKSEAAFVIERLMDIIAERVEVDPVVVRQRNFIPPDQFPYLSATGSNYDSGNYPEALRRATELVEYDRYRAEQESRRQDDDSTREIGIGVAVCLEPSSATRKDAAGTPGFYGIKMKLDTTGNIIVYPEDPDLGTSHETSIVQIVSSELGVDPATVKVVQGDTDATPYGSGSYSSRFAVVGTSACYEAAWELERQLKAIVAHNWSVPEEELVLHEDVVKHSSEDWEMSFEEIAYIAYHLIDHLPEGMDPGIEFTHYFRAPNVGNVEGKGRTGNFSSHPYTADIAVVEVDTGTGLLSVKEYVTVHDCGVILNEKVVEGQHLGALAHGFGGALFEELLYDENGQPQHRGFIDYLVPTANEIPEVTMDHIETPSPFTPGGHKGSGETGTVSVPPAITNAVEDALRDYGVSIREKSPMKPDFIWEQIHS